MYLVFLVWVKEDLLESQVLAIDSHALDDTEGSLPDRFINGLGILGVAVEVEDLDHEVKLANDALVGTLESVFLAAGVLHIETPIVGHLLPILVLLVNYSDPVVQHLLPNLLFPLSFAEFLEFLPQERIIFGHFIIGRRSIHISMGVSGISGVGLTHVGGLLLSVSVIGTHVTAFEYKVIID